MVSNTFICSLDLYVDDAHKKEPNKLCFLVFLIIKANW